MLENEERRDPIRQRAQQTQPTPVQAMFAVRAQADREVRAPLVAIHENDEFIWQLQPLMRLVADAMISVQGVFSFLRAV